VQAISLTKNVTNCLVRLNTVIRCSLYCDLVYMWRLDYEPFGVLKKLHDWVLELGSHFICKPFTTSKASFCNHKNVKTVYKQGTKIKVHSPKTLLILSLHYTDREEMTESLSKSIRPERIKETAVVELRSGV
jgi:hypothetical protein